MESIGLVYKAVAHNIGWPGVMFMVGCDYCDKVTEQNVGNHYACCEKKADNESGKADYGSPINHETNDSVCGTPQQGGRFASLSNNLLASLHDGNDGNAHNGVFLSCVLLHRPHQTNDIL